MVSVGPMLIRIRKHFHTGGPLRHRGIQAGSTLFDRRKVEPRCIRDRLQEIGIRCVSIGSRNCRVLVDP